MVASLSSPALADALLPIGGAYGDEAGCEFFMTGQAERGSFAVVTPDTFTTETLACYFETLVAKRQADFELEASCRLASESTTESITVNAPQSNGVFVALGSVATAWGPLSRCPGTEELFEPMGLPV
jgi:hypothetical protein